MQDDIYKPAETDNRLKRPLLLTILCILTFIGSGSSSASYLMIFSSFDEVMPLIDEFAETFPAVKQLLTAPRSFFLAGFMLYVFSLIGASLMWRLKKAGFHFYTGAQVMIVFLPVFFIKDFPFPLLDGLVSASFIALYYSNYKLFT
jgi:hypothetical protein